MKYFYSSIISLLVLSLSLCFFVADSVKPADEVFLPTFNQSFYLQDETYIFQLVPTYSVPNQLLRHTIYTGSTASVAQSTKRALFQNSHENIDLSEEDHDHLHQLLGGDVPNFVRVNKRKRSLPVEDGIRQIRLTPKIALLVTPSEVTQGRKRAVADIGTVFCLHIPFFTTCDNSADLTTVKTALQASVDEMHAELDSYTATNDARVNALTVTLNTQRGIISSMIANAKTTNYLLAQVASSVQVNAAQIADGDFQAHSQINYLKRVTGSLLKFCNALASTDPRAVVAQPSLSKLFGGFVNAMQALNTSGYIPIVDYSSTFTWNETLLPAQSVKNTTQLDCITATCDASFSNCCPPNSDSITSTQYAFVFSALFKVTCQADPTNGYPQVPGCVSPSTVVNDPTHNWIYGPFHKAHYGIYNVNVATSSTSSLQAYVMQPVVQPVIAGTHSNTITIGITSQNAFCVQFLGYKMFSSLPLTPTDSNNNPTLVNGIQPGAISSDCDVYRLIEAQSISTTIFSLYAESEGVVIPFYSSCDIPVLKNQLNVILGSAVPDTVSTFNYVCTNAWNANASPNCGGTDNNYGAAKSIPNVDMFMYHWITPGCYINIEPSWLELDYYIAPPSFFIPNIPRGYSLNQFTINNDGELASSIDFVYTDQWLQAYKIERISVNHLVTDEVSELEGSPVLFHLDSNFIVDESDSFFGEGNNGRDCIHQSPSYSYNLLNCFFQNNNQMYSVNQYFSGSITTTGIARYVNKYNFSVSMNAGTVTFQLNPNADADFSFSVEMDGQLCPKLVNQQSLTSSCIVSLFYTGSQTVTMTSASSTQTPIGVSFTNYQSSNITIGLGTWNVIVSDRTCFILDCHYTSEFSVVQLITPDIQLISASDKALETQVAFSIDKTITTTISQMNSVISQLQDVQTNLDTLNATLESLNFNVSQLIPYQNFTDLRNQLNSIISNIPNGTPASKCDGPWNSAVCWFQQFAGTLITVAICVVVVVVLYVIFVRFGLAKKIGDATGISKKSTKNRNVSEYNAD